MPNLSIELPIEIIYGLAYSRGWQAEIEDTTAELDGDEYPKIPNPISAVQFVELAATQFIIDTVRKGARDQLVSDFKSTFARVEDQVKQGAFDSLLLSGDVEQIRELVKQSL